MENMRKNFSQKSSNWHLVDMKIYEANDFIFEGKKNYKRLCLVLFRYYSEDFKKNEEVVFIRDLEKTKSFYDWKMLDYKDVKLNNVNVGINSGFDYSFNTDIKI